MWTWLVFVATLAVAVDAATTCTGKPTVINGVFLSSCTANAPVGKQCTAVCNKNNVLSYESSPAPVATCTASGWSIANGPCSPVCPGLPLVVLPGTSWNSSCANTRSGSWCSGTCSAGWSGNPRVQCTGGQWKADSPVSGKCVQGQVACSSRPTIGILNGAWPAACDDVPAGYACRADCNINNYYWYNKTGYPVSVCQANGGWSTPTSPAFCEQGPVGGIPSPSPEPPASPSPAPECQYSVELLIGCADPQDCWYGDKYDVSGIPPLKAKLMFPQGIVADSKGNLWWVDNGAQRVYVLNATTNNITLIAGNGVYQSPSPDGNPATATYLDSPQGVAVDEARQAVYIGGGSQNRVWKVDLQTGIMTSVAGLPDQSSGFNGNNIQGTSAKLNNPTNVVVMGDTLYIADRYNARVRQLNLNTGIIDAYAGMGFCCTAGDGGLAVDAYVTQPYGLYADPAGGLYITQDSGSELRKVNTTGYINAVATGLISTSFGIGRDNAGRLIIAQGYSGGLIRVDPATGAVAPVLLSSGSLSETTYYVTTIGRNIIVSTQTSIKKLVPNAVCP